MQILDNAFWRSASEQAGYLAIYWIQQGNARLAGMAAKSAATYARGVL